MKKHIAATALLTTIGGLATNAAPESEPKLDETTVLANRGLTDLNKVGSAVTILDAEDFEKSGVFHIDSALKFVPGVISESIAGQRGSSSSLLLRGTTTQYAQIRVDGVRISGPNITTGNFFGGTNLGGLSRIEVLRGPQSALYGGDAIGGVLGLYSTKGIGTPSGSLRIGGGSFNSFNTSLSLQGQLDQLSYALTLGYETTDNDLPNNQFEQWSYALRLDYQVHDSLDIGMTLRGFESDFRRPSYSDPAFARAADDETTSVLATLFANLQINEIWSSKLTLGFYDEEYDTRTFASPRFFTTEGTKYAAYWDNTLKWNDRHTTTTGAVYEKTDYSYASLFFTLQQDSRKSDQYGFYVNHSWDVTDALTLNGGVRWEDYDTYGSETTWRAAAAYRIKQTDTKLRASVGKGFRPPSFTELFGFGGGSNFDLTAEQSIGWDVGVDQKFCDGQYALSVTYFENRIEDFIRSSFGPPPAFVTTTSNVPGISETNGIEVEASAHWLNNRLHTTLVYTWLDKTLAGQPENSAGLRVHASVTDKLDAGFSINYLDDRTFGGNELDSYILVNLHASYEVNSNVTLNVRVENLFDEEYEYANFGTGATQETYPGRGQGIFGGVTVKW